MLRTRICMPLLALTVSGATYAQPGGAGTSVVLYGLVNPGFSMTTNVGPQKRTVNTMPPNSGGTAPSRIGVRGSESLGGNLKAIFNLESGMALGTGSFNQGGRAWGRQAYVGFEGEFGRVTLGRQDTMTFWNGVGGHIHGGGLYGIASLDPYYPNARADNSIVWRGKFGNWSFGAQYSMGRDSIPVAAPNPAANNCGEISNNSCRQWSVLMRYDTKDWGVAVSYDDMNGRNVGAPPDAVFGGLNSPDKHDTRLLAQGWFTMGQTKVNLGLAHRRNEGTPSRKNNNIYFIGAAHKFSPTFTLSAQLLSLRYSGNSDYNAELVALRGTYALSKRTSVAAQVGFIRNHKLSAIGLSGGVPGTAPLPGVNQSGFNVSVQHSF